MSPTCERRVWTSSGAMAKRIKTYRTVESNNHLRRDAWHTRIQSGHHEHTCNVQKLREPVASDVAVPDACRPPHHPCRPSSGLVIGRGTRETRHNNVSHDVAHSEPLLVLFLHSSQSDNWLPQLSGSVRYLFVETKSPFLLSLLSCFGHQWPCDKRGRLRLPHRGTA